MSQIIRITLWALAFITLISNCLKNVLVLFFRIFGINLIFCIETLLFLVNNRSELIQCARKNGLRTRIIPFLDGMRKLNETDTDVSLLTFYVGINEFILFTTPEAVKVLLYEKDSTYKSKLEECLTPVFGDSLLLRNGPTWKLIRKDLNEVFTKEQLKHHTSVVNKHSKRLVRSLEMFEGKPNCIKLTVLENVSLSINDFLLGIDINENMGGNAITLIRSFGRCIYGCIATLINPFNGFMFHHLGIGNKKWLESLNYINSVINARIEHLNKLIAKSKINTDKLNGVPTFFRVLSRQMNEKENAHCKDDYVSDSVKTFIAAGYQTTAFSVIWTLYLIGLHPEVLEKLYNESCSVFGNSRKNDDDITYDDLKKLTYLECVIKESQRLYPPVTFSNRRCTEDFVIGNKLVKKGSDCLVFMWGLHRNENVFPEPERFIPERFDVNQVQHQDYKYTYMPFFGGPRNCIGRNLATLNIKIFLTDVIRNFHIRSLDPRDKVIPEFEVATKCHGPVRLIFSRRTV